MPSAMLSETTRALRARRAMGVDATRWTPGDLPGIALWASADRGINDGAVSLWNDRSGWGNNLTNAGAAATKPTLTADAIAAGRPGVVWDGTDDVLTVADHASMQAGTDDFTFFFVARLTAPATTQALWVQTANGGLAAVTTAHGFSILSRATQMVQATVRFDGDASYALPFSNMGADGIFAIVGTVDRDGDFSLYKNGGVPVTADISADAAESLVGGADVRFGDNLDGGFDFDDTLAEVGWIRGIPSVAKLNRAGAYWAAKYGLSWSDIT